jgi:hypothetical protein
LYVNVLFVCMWLFCSFISFFLWMFNQLHYLCNVAFSFCSQLQMDFF